MQDSTKLKLDLDEILAEYATDTASGQFIVGRVVDLLDGGEIKLDLGIDDADEYVSEIMLTYAVRNGQPVLMARSAKRSIHDE